jgi:prepilin-type N-terminal cleavage/methylation domain-containing protein
MRKGFTLIEMMISITILSIMMIFLYESYASINRSNRFYKKEATKLINNSELKKVFYLDLSLSLYNSIKILNQEKDEDVIFFQSSHSLHQRINPYIAYVKKDSKLYRLESLKPFKEYPLNIDDDYIVDELGEIKLIRLYKNQKNDTYLLNIVFKEKAEIVMKVMMLNQF